MRVDFRFEGTPIVVEVLGYHSHHTKEQLRCDTERMNALMADGFSPYQFTYHHVVSDPDDVVAVTRRALAPYR